jgi:hypothetical protein
MILPARISRETDTDYQLVIENAITDDRSWMSPDIWKRCDVVDGPMRSA